MKKTLKLILTVLLSLALLSSFVACDGGDDKDSGKNDNSDSSVGGDDTGSTDNGGSTGGSGNTGNSGNGSTDDGGSTDDSESADINPYDGLKFTVVDGGYEVSGIGTCTDTDIVIPSTYNGLPVVSIGNWAFYKCDNFTSVVIPNSVTSIGEGAFAFCYDLTSAVIPSSVETIGINAFRECFFLETAIFEENSRLLRIGNYAFSDCDSLTSIVIPASVEVIDCWAFSNCSSLITVTFEENSRLSNIRDGAFAYCNKLVEVINHSSLNITVRSSNYGYVAYYAKEVHTGESKIVKVDDYLFYTYNGVNYLVGYVGDDTDLVLPDSYNGESYVINKYAFYSSSLTSVVIPDSVTSIGDSVFNGCFKLVEVINHSSLDITAGSRDYGSVAYYTKEVHTGESKIVNVDDYLFYTYGGVNYLVGYVGDDTELVLPDSYNGESYVINQYAFYKCSDITSVIIPDSVTSIGDYAFSWCRNFTSVVIGDSVTSIGDYAFQDCSNLTSVVIPDSVTHIGKSAFRDCFDLTDVYYTGTEEEWAAIIIDSDNTDLTSVTIHYNYVPEE